MPNSASRLLIKAPAAFSRRTEAQHTTRVRFASPLAAALMDGLSEQPATTSDSIYNCSGMRISAVAWHFVDNLLDRFPHEGTDLLHARAIGAEVAVAGPGCRAEVENLRLVVEKKLDIIDEPE